jgi:predicted nucleic acid-binding protein
MSDKVFIDSNILIYAYSMDEPKKQKIVNNILDEHGLILISTQTVNEFVNVVTRKKMLNNMQASAVVDELFSQFLIVAVDQAIIQKALVLADTCRYSYFDCLMLASALMSNCSILYSEDMHHLHIVGNTLKIVNPFL